MRIKRAVHWTVFTLVLAGAPPIGAQQTRPGGVDPALAEQLNDLVKRAAGHFRAGKPGEAEVLLVEAGQLDPQNPNIVYDLACARALQDGKHEQAMDDLERAASLGYTEFGWLASDPDLDALRAMPRFNRLLEQRDVYLRGAAEATLSSVQKQYGVETYRYELDADLRLTFAVSMDNMDEALFQDL